VQLQKQGNGLFAPADPSVAPQPAAATTEVVGGALEDANVTAVGTLVGLIEVHRRFEAYQRMIQAVDESNRQATSEIGRV
jgi:flagellar basal-body rod protein FlgG